MKAMKMVAMCSILAVGGSAFAAQTASEAAKGPVVPPSPRRLPDGRPNWTGFWAPMHGLLEVDIGLGGTPEGVSGPRRPPAVRHAQLKSPFKEQFAKTTADAVERGFRPDRTALCFPPGMPGMMDMLYGMELLQTPGQVAITSEWQAASRRIWLDRKTHPNDDELDPTYAGDSIGHWEGDRLVVDTVGLREEVPLNPEGLPHSKKLRIREVFSEKPPGILVDLITIDDPDAFVSSWSYSHTYRYRPDLTIREYVCLDNNRNIDADGNGHF